MRVENHLYVQCCAWHQFALLTHEETELDCYRWLRRHIVVGLCFLVLAIDPVMKMKLEQQESESRTAVARQCETSSCIIACFRSC